MARPSWLVDGKRIATKIKSASETSDPIKVKWKSNPTRACPNCNHVIDNSDVAQDWPGLPRGVKFDPSDQELLWHLYAKVGVGNAKPVKPHPFIDEFIPTVDKEDGICYTHPEKLPGVKQDGSASHFFHRTMKAYSTGSRKRRKIQCDDQCNGEVRWHKTGKTKPVIMDGIHKGCKKILVLYMSMAKGGKAEKTNWVMHQIHIGPEEDEEDGKFVVSKVLYQQQSKQCNKNEQDLQENLESALAKPDPHTPTSSVPNPPRSKETANLDLQEEAKSDTHESSVMDPETENKENAANPQSECEKPDDHDNHMMGDLKWSEGESQFLLNSQQLADGMFMCDEILQSQSCGIDEERRANPRLSDYASIGADHLKKDLEDCQNLSQFDLSNVELDTPPDLRLSQLLKKDLEDCQNLSQFNLSNVELDTPPDLRLSQLDLQLGSQESLFSWAGNKVVD